MEGVSECLCRNVILVKFLYAGTRVRGSASTSNSFALNTQTSRSDYTEISTLNVIQQLQGTELSRE